MKQMIVGGYLGYQWADFHCGFEMTFLCEYKVNEIEAWRRRRQMIPDLQRKISSPVSIASSSNSEENSSVKNQLGASQIKTYQRAPSMPLSVALSRCCC